MVSDLWVPWSMPVGMLTLALASAAATSSIPILRDASAFGSSLTRTAYF